MNEHETLFPFAPPLRSWLSEDHEGRVMTLVEDGSFVEYVRQALDALDAIREAVGSALLISANNETKMPREDWLRIEAAFLAAGAQTPEVAVETPVRKEGEPIYADPYTRIAWLHERVDHLRAAIEHVIEDSPGTPDSVKKYLLRTLEGSWGDSYEEAILRG